MEEDPSELLFVKKNTLNQGLSPISVRLAPLLILAGIVQLLAFFFWPRLPVASAVALISLGATITTIARLQHTPACRVWIVVHLFVYASLYLVLLGAVCDGAVRQSGGALAVDQAIDLGMSAVLMVLVVRLAAAGLARAGGAQIP